MAMVNGLNNVKDSRWLQLEVCREFQRNKCTRPDSECKFAHPPNGVDIQNGRVVACYDSIKGRCNRDKPPCKYFHPPQHLKDQLLINGRNHLAFKNALLHQMPLQTVLTTGQLPLVRAGISANILTAGLRPPASLVQQFAAAAACAAVANQQQQQQSHHHHASQTAQQQQQQQQQQHQQQVQAQQRLQAQAQAATVAAAAASLLNGSATAVLSTASANNSSNLKGPSNPYVTNLPTIASPYGTFPTSYGLTSMTAAAAEQLTSNFGIVPASALIGSNKAARTDRLEVCREFQRGNCKRAESECRFAHPPEHVQVDSDDGLITVCMDFVKSRCLRDQCRYFHPPPHLQAQLKAAQTRAHTTTALPNSSAAAAAAATHVLAQAASTLAAGKKRARDTEDLLMTFPGVLPMTKRPALEKSGLPVFQPAAMVSAYQQALAMHQSFVPLAYKWSS